MTHSTPSEIGPIVGDTREQPIANLGNQDITAAISGERVTTFAAAEKINPYELARRWADRLRLPTRVAPEKAEAVGLAVRTAEDELDELATMSALRTWLDRWTANQIHAALRSGATVEQVAAASGKTTAEVVACWRKYDAGQRDLWQSMPNIARTAEHDQVAAILAADDAPGSPDRSA